MLTANLEKKDGIVITALLAIVLIANINNMPVQAQLMCEYDGTEDNDILRGSNNSDDDMCGYGGNDRIYGRGGDDYIEADDYNGDTVTDGDDYINAGAGNDLLVGGFGADNFICGNGYDVVVDYYPISDGDTISNCEEAYGEEELPFPSELEQAADEISVERPSSEIAEIVSDVNTLRQENAQSE